jgi:hypothetical protein
MSVCAQTEHINDLWKKSKIEIQNANYKSACDLLSEIINLSNRADTVCIKSKIAMAQILGDIGKIDTMNVIISELSSYQSTHFDNAEVAADIKALIAYSNEISRKNTDFKDDICGIWISDYASDASGVPFLALKIMKRGKDYVMQILPYCSFATSNKMYTKTPYRHISQRPATFGNKPDIHNNQARLFFGDENFKKGNVLAAQMGAFMTLGLGEAIISNIESNSDNSSIVGDIAKIAVVSLATNIVASLFSRLSVSKKTITTYDMLMERLFAGCADLYLQQNIFIKKSNGYQEEKSSTIKFMMYKLYPEYDIIFMTKQREIFGYKEFTKIETVNHEQYKTAKTNICDFNRQSYEKLKEKTAHFYTSILKKQNDDLLKNIYENFKYSTQGLLYSEQKLRNGVYKGRVNSAGVRNGYGHYKWNNGNQYNGEWKNGNMDGFGQILFANGSEYTGNLSKNQKHGQGTFKNSDGEYRGGFYNDKYDGEGELIKADVTIKGIFKNGNIVKGKEIYASGDVFEGQWNRHKNIRNGRMTYANGDCYAGQWLLQNGKWMKEGNGSMTCVNGETLIGKWKNDEFKNK